MVSAGDKFGKLTAIELKSGDKYDNKIWLCECECGNLTEAKEKYLLNGHKKSCGCLYGIGKRKHGCTKTRLFKIWCSMHERCERKSHMHYEDYGGRGISVCDKWNEFVAFKAWAESNGYKDNLTIDRKDVDGNYCPENCRWVTMKIQQNNKRSNRYIEFDGETHTISEWSEITGIGKTTIKERLNMGWPIKDVLTKPIRKRTKGYRKSST